MISGIFYLFFKKLISVYIISNTFRSIVKIHAEQVALFLLSLHIVFILSDLQAFQLY